LQLDKTTPTVIPDNGGIDEYTSQFISLLDKPNTPLKLLNFKRMNQSYRLKGNLIRNFLMVGENMLYMNPDR